MESLVDGISSLPNGHNSFAAVECNTSLASQISHPPSMKQSEYKESSTSYPLAMHRGSNVAHTPTGSVTSSKHFEANENTVDQLAEGCSGEQVLAFETKSSIKDFHHGSKNSTSNDDLNAAAKGLPSESGITYCPSPQNNFYSATQYTEAKQSFSNTEVSECASSTVDKSGESGDVSNSCDLVESRKTSFYRGSTGSDVSDESSSSSFNSTVYKPHKANDSRWDAIQAIRAREGTLGFNHFRLLKRLGCGDIGSVFLAELIGTRCFFAMKVMDKAALESRKKLVRAQTEREILQSLDHPFLPTLYSHFETDKFSCLVMEFCPGGDLHALRQKQAGKFFPEHAARFYVAEILLALEYLHMLGIIYRDLKPENVLVREDGHIMLSDFDLSLRCAVSPTLVRSSNSSLESKSSSYCVQPACIEPSCVVQPACIQPSCFTPRFLSKTKKEKKSKQKTETYNQVNRPLPELLAEPTNARSMSFVGTHEYLAPEIIKGEGHGSAVDWWTFGIFLYELLFGQTPFKGAGNRATLFNVVGQPLRFPETPSVSFAARDLIRGLLVKEPQHRLAYRRGATEIKQHPFFQNVNWALIRCTSPPDVPKPSMTYDMPRTPPAEKAPGVDVKPSGQWRVCIVKLPMRFNHSLSSSITFCLHFSQKPFTRLSARALANAMAGTPENFSTDATADAANADDDVKFGFQRSEMYQTKLAGTATSYDRHLFLCYKSHETWPARLEASDSDLLPKLLSAALKARKDDIKIKTLLTICEVRDDMEVSDGDILIFPEMIKYRNLKESDVDAFVDDVLVNGNPWSSELQESLSDSYVFVCAHNLRDRRCGVCGPILIEEFSKVIESKGLKDKVRVTACSHIGGHKYAGNVIIFSSGKDGEIVGHWYGYVTPNDVPVLLDEHIGEGKVIERLWRGQMGQYEKVTDKVDEQKVPEVTKEEKKLLENGSQESSATGFSCCQGAEGVSCCRDASAEQKENKKGQGTVSNWFGKWEQREILTAVGVVGAVAIVAVAYGCYKKSR